MPNGKHVPVTKLSAKISSFKDKLTFRNLHVTYLGEYDFEVGTSLNVSVFRRS